MKRRNYFLLILILIQAGTVIPLNILYYHYHITPIYTSGFNTSAADNAQFNFNLYAGDNLSLQLTSSSSFLYSLMVSNSSGTFGSGQMNTMTPWHGNFYPAIEINATETTTITLFLLPGDSFVSIHYTIVNAQAGVPMIILFVLGIISLAVLIVLYMKRTIVKYKIVSTEQKDNASKEARISHRGWNQRFFSKIHEFTR